MAIRDTDYVCQERYSMHIKIQTVCVSSDTEYPLRCRLCMSVEIWYVH